MKTAILITGVIVFIILRYFIATEFSNIANLKGFSGNKYFWWSMCLGLIGWLMVIALPGRIDSREKSDSFQDNDDIPYI